MSDIRIMSAVDYRPQAVTRVKDAQRPHGLVLSSTSPKRDEYSLIDARMARLKRMKKAVLTTARMHQDFVKKGFSQMKPALLTTTYRPGADWSPKHISRLIDHMRKWYNRHTSGTFRYAWVLELQRNGNPHYHIVFWLPKGKTMPKPDKQGWWPHGFTEIKWARKPVGYMAKYVSKGFHKDDGHPLTMPAGARIYGVGGLTGDQRDEKAWWMSPTWVRELWNVEDRPRAAIGGGWMALKTGEWRPSPYEVRVIGGKVYVAKREDMIVYLDDCIEFQIQVEPLLRDMMETAENCGGWWQMHTSDQGERFAEKCERRRFSDFRPDFDVEKYDE